MTKNQFRRALLYLDLEQTEFARLMQYDARTVRRWIGGELSVPKAVALVLRLLAAGKISQDDIRQYR